VNQPAAVSRWYFLDPGQTGAKLQDRRITAQIDQTAADIDKCPDRLTTSRFFKQAEMRFNHGFKPGWLQKRQAQDLGFLPQLDF